MFDYEIKGNVVEVKLDNGKTCKIGTKWVENTTKSLGIDEYEAVEMWLVDNDMLIDEEQEELNQKAKENKSIKVIKAKDNTQTKKTQKERVKKENPTKEGLIKHLAQSLEGVVNDIIIENPTKIITFSYNGELFKLDLVQKRKEKTKK